MDFRRLVGWLLSIFLYCLCILSFAMALCPWIRNIEPDNIERSAINLMRLTHAIYFMTMARLNSTHSQCVLMPNQCKLLRFTVVFIPFNSFIDSTHTLMLYACSDGLWKSLEKLSAQKIPWLASIPIDFMQWRWQWKSTHDDLISVNYPRDLLFAKKHRSDRKKFFVSGTKNGV